MTSCRHFYGPLLLFMIFIIASSSAETIQIALLAPEHSPVEGLNISSSVVALYLSGQLLNESGLLQQVDYK